MKCFSPPRWMETILLLTLAPRDRESVPGDLHEEYAVRRPCSFGMLRANVWYARQVLSFMPHHMAAVAMRTPVPMLVSGLTALCGMWLGAMGLRLHHPGYGQGEVISIVIVAQAVLTVLALCFHPVTLLRRTAVAGALAIVWLAVKAATATLRGDHLEGYILLIAFFLLAQAGLTIQSLPEWHSNSTP